MSDKNLRIHLRARPVGNPNESDFECREAPIPQAGEGQFLIQNLYISLDAGFRQWMNEGSGDEYMPAMEIGAPVTGLILGKVLESKNSDYTAGELVMGRTAWESYSLADGTDYITKMVADPSVPLSAYLGLLGATGLTAYFGLVDIGKPQPGDTVLVSTAAGAVGNVACQMAKILGCRVVGTTSSDEKCRWLVDELGIDAAINYKAPGGVAAGLDEHCPDGVDVYFDNVAGDTLDQTLARLKQGARVILSGALAAYDRVEPPPGPRNMFKVITARALLQGFMVTDQVERYPEGIAQLSAWLREGKIKNVEQMIHGVENTGDAFCQMFRGGNRGKLVIEA